MGCCNGPSWCGQIASQKQKRSGCQWGETFTTATWTWYIPLWWNFQSTALSLLIWTRKCSEGLMWRHKRTYKSQYWKSVGNNSPSNCNKHEAWWNSEDLIWKTRGYETGGAFEQGQAGACACSECHSCGGCLDCKCDFCWMVTTTFGIFCVLGECKHWGGSPIPIWHLSIVRFCCRSSNHANILVFQLHVFLLRYCNPHGGSECCTSPKTRHIHWRSGAVFVGFTFSSIHPFDDLSWMCNGCVCKCWLSSVTTHSKVYGQ